MKSTGAIILLLSNDIHDSDILEAWGVRYLPRTANTRKKIPPFIWRLRELENIYLCLKLGYWSTRLVKDKVPKLPGHTLASYCVISPMSLNVY
jgi:hypothetical protein